MKILLDFDGTIVEHCYPDIGRENFGCFEIIRKWQRIGLEIHLNTYRANLNDGTLEKALEFIYTHPEHNIFPFASVKKSKITPEKWDWDYHLTKGVIYIDDVTPGIPLKRSKFGNGDMVDWDEVNRQFIKYGIYE